MEKRKRILIEILIILIILLAILLPKLIGKTEVESFDGFIDGPETLNGHDIGINVNNEENYILLQYFPNSKILEYQTIEEGIIELENGQIDAFTCKLEEAEKIVSEKEELVIYQLPLIDKYSVDANKDELLYLVIRASDCAYNPTKKRLGAILEPGISIACLTGLEEGSIIKK